MTFVLYFLTSKREAQRAALIELGTNLPQSVVCRLWECVYIASALSNWLLYRFA